MNQIPGQIDLNREQSTSTNMFSNKKYGGGQHKEGKAIPFQANSKPYIDSSTMVKIESLMEKRTDGHYACNNCGYNSRQKCHMQEHVEKHIEGLEYPCDSCKKIMRSSLSLRSHKRKTCSTMNKMLKL